MSIIIVVCDVYGSPEDYHDIQLYIHSSFLGASFKLSEFCYVIDTELHPNEIHNEICKYLKPRDEAYVFTLARDAPLKTKNHGDAESWLQERMANRH